MQTPFKRTTQEVNELAKTISLYDAIRLPDADVRTQPRFEYEIDMFRPYPIKVCIQTSTSPSGRLLMKTWPQTDENKQILADFMAEKYPQR